MSRPNFRLLNDQALLASLVFVFVQPDIRWPSYEEYVDMETEAQQAMERRAVELGLWCFGEEKEKVS